MDVKRNRILAAIVSITCLCNWWTSGALGAEKVSDQERLTKVARRSQARRIPSRPSDAIVYKQLARTVDLSSLTLNTPFGEAIEILRNSTEPALNIVVLWRDLSENAFVEQSTPISMDGVSGIRLRTGLELLLRAVSNSPGELGYVVEGGVIIIATRDSLPTRRVTRIYDISDLVAPPANYRFAPLMGPFGPAGLGFGGGWMGQRPIGGFGGGWRAYSRAVGRPISRAPLLYGPGWRGRRADEVANLITDTIAPRSWR